MAPGPPRALPGAEADGRLLIVGLTAEHHRDQSEEKVYEIIAILEPMMNDAEPSVCEETACTIQTVRQHLHWLRRLWEPRYVLVVHCCLPRRLWQVPKQKPEPESQKNPQETSESEDSSLVISVPEHGQEAGLQLTGVLDASRIPPPPHNHKGIKEMPSVYPEPPGVTPQRPPAAPGILPAPHPPPSSSSRPPGAQGPDRDAISPSQPHRGRVEEDKDLSPPPEHPQEEEGPAALLPHLAACWDAVSSGGAIPESLPTPPTPLSFERLVPQPPVHGPHPSTPSQDVVRESQGARRSPRSLLQTKQSPVPSAAPHRTCSRTFPGSVALLWACCGGSMSFWERGAQS
nr:vegetative cell wall protein gp1-like isoform X1 [Anas platyrhynchos]